MTPDQSLTTPDLEELHERNLAALDSAIAAVVRLKRERDELREALEILIAGSTTPTNGVTRAPSWDAIERAARVLAGVRAAEKRTKTEGVKP